MCVQLTLFCCCCWWHLLVLAVLSLFVSPSRRVCWCRQAGRLCRLLGFSFILLLTAITITIIIFFPLFVIIIIFFIIIFFIVVIVIVFLFFPISFVVFWRGRGRL